MDAQTCIAKLGYVGVLTFATVDENGAPQVRNISAVHYAEDGIYFYTARGKNFCRELLRDGRVQILALTKYKEMIRLSAVAQPVADSLQDHYKDIIFSEQPYLTNVYPDDSREIGIVFCIRKGNIEYFNLGVRPIFSETYSYNGGALPTKKGFYITDQCIGCGTCTGGCPQQCIEEGEPFRIHEEHCLHCGRCYENCPVQAIERY